MGYSKQYKEWTNSNVEVDFDVKEESARLAPGGEKDLVCDGIGFIKLTKDEDGLLKCIMKPVDGEPNEVVTWYDIMNRFNGNSTVSPTV